MSILRTWLIRISPAIGKSGGKRTLVGNGRTRDVIGQTTARLVFSVNPADEITSAAPPRLLTPQRRIEICPDQIARVGDVYPRPHSSTISRPASGPQSNAPE